MTSFSKRALEHRRKAVGSMAVFDFPPQAMKAHSIFLVSLAIVHACIGADYWIESGQTLDLTLSHGDQIKFAAAQSFVLHVASQQGDLTGHWLTQVDGDAGASSYLDDVYQYGKTNIALVKAVCSGELNGEYFDDVTSVSATFVNSVTSQNVSVAVTLLAPEAEKSDYSTGEVWYTSVPDCAEEWSVHVVNMFTGYYQYLYTPADPRNENPWDVYEKLSLNVVEGGSCSYDYYWKEGQYEPRTVSTDEGLAVVWGYDTTTYETPSSCGLVDVAVTFAQGFNPEPYGPEPSAVIAGVIVLLVMAVVCVFCVLGGSTLAIFGIATAASRNGRRYQGLHEGGPAAPVNAYGEPHSYQPPGIPNAYGEAHPHHAPADATAPPSYDTTLRHDAKDVPY